MHALRHVHKLLVSQGTLVDLHPVTEEQVEAVDGAIVGVIEDAAFAVDLPNAEACVQDAVRDGLYAAEAEIEFDFLQHFDEVEEMIEAKQESLADQRSLVHRIRATAPPLVIREHVILRRFRVC